MEGCLIEIVKEKVCKEIASDVIGNACFDDSAECEMGGFAIGSLNVIVHPYRAETKA